MKVKYLGSSHVREIGKGEKAAGRFDNDPLPVTLVWNLENNHIIDTDEYPDVSEEWWEFIIKENPDFRDVTDLKRIPVSEGQRLWQGLSESSPNLVGEEGEAVEGASMGAGGATGAAPTGGSTAGARGTTGRGARST